MIRMIALQNFQSARAGLASVDEGREFETADAEFAKMLHDNGIAGYLDTKAAAAAAEEEPDPAPKPITNNPAPAPKPARRRRSKRN